MIKSIHILFLFFVPLLMVAQKNPGNENLNLLDTNGKKHGKFIEYLDRSWRPVKKTEDAYYSRYCYYEHGLQLTIKVREFSGSDKLTLNGKAAENSRGNPQLLNGRYCWQTSKGSMKDIINYKNGEIVTDSVYFKTRTKKDTADRVNIFFDNTNKYEDQAYSWHVEKYDKTGTLIFKGHFRKYPLLDYKTGIRKYVWAVYGE